MIRIGAADRTVHPYYTRRMFRLLRQQQTNVTYSELADKEHWWWDTYKTNDGGVVNDPVIRNFAISHAKNAGKPSAPASKTFSLFTSTGKQWYIPVIKYKKILVDIKSAQKTQVMSMTFRVDSYCLLIIHWSWLVWHIHKQFVLSQVLKKNSYLLAYKRKTQQQQQQQLLFKSIQTKILEWVIFCSSEVWLSIVKRVSDVITQTNADERDRILEGLKLFQAHTKQMFLKQFLKWNFGIHFRPIFLSEHTFVVWLLQVSSNLHFIFTHRVFRFWLMYWYIYIFNI